MQQAACDKQVFAPFPSGCGVWRGGGVDQQLFISTLGFTFGGGHVTIVLHSGPRYSATTKQQLQMDKPAPATTGRQPVKGLLLVNGRCVSIGCLSVNEGSLPLSVCLRSTGAAARGVSLQYVMCCGNSQHCLQMQINVPHTSTANKSERQIVCWLLGTQLRSSIWSEEVRCCCAVFVFSSN